MRVEPEAPMTCGGYDLDAFVVQIDADGMLDFRLELASGTEFYWAFPTAPNDRLRLVLVDSAVRTIADPELIEDPFVCDLELERRLPFSDLLASVAIEIAQRSYHFRAEIRGGGRVVELTYKPPR